MKSILISVLLLLPVSCAAQEIQQPATPVVTNTDQAEVLVKCAYKYDKRWDVEFLARNKTVYHPPQFPELTVYRIKDTKGVNWAINEYEWADYTCTETTIPKG